MSYRTIGAETLNRAKKLRMEGRLSLKEITQETGISKATLSVFLRDLPLTPAEIAAKAKAGSIDELRRRGEQAQERRRPTSRFYEIMMRRAKSTDQKGAIAEAAVVFRMIIWGFVPHIPLCQGTKIDISVFVPDTMRLLRVQVKMARYGKYGRPYINLTWTGRSKKRTRYSAEECDVVVGYDPRTDTCFVHLMEEIKDRRASISMAKANEERWDKLLDLGVAAGRR